MPVKVLHIITKLEFGGAQSNTLYTVSHLDKALFDVKLAAGPGGLLDGKAPGDRVAFVPRLVRSISPINDILAVLSLRKLITAERPSIVHTHSSKAGITGRIAAFLAGTPVIVHTFHGFGFHERQAQLKKRLFILLERLCALISDALVFVSRANMEYASRCAIGGPGERVLIRSGIPLTRYPAFPRRDPKAAAKRRELGVPEDAVLVVSIGNLKPQKNTGDFMAAAGRLSKAGKSSVFMLIGGGEQLDEARSAAERAGLRKRLLLPGWREDSAEILASADIFALTSLWEGLPKSLVEALRSGLPSVCYRTDGVTDILRDGVNGYAVAPGDLDAFCGRLGELINDPAAREAMSAGASATDLSEFDIDLMVRKQENLYLELLKKKDGRSRTACPA